MSWHWFFRIDEGFAEAANPVSAVTPDPDHLYLFLRAVDGSMRWTKWDTASGWDPQGWMRLATRAGTADGVVVTAAAGADSVTAVARDQDHLELFVCDVHGTIYWNRWEVASWAAFWAQLDMNFDDGVVTSAIRATSVKAVARNANQLQLFVSDNLGRVFSVRWDSAGSWGSWFRIDNGFSSAALFLSVTPVARDSDHLDLLVTGKDDQIYWTHCDSNCDSASGWASWSPINAGDDFAKGATSVAAVARNPDVIDLFVTGTDGRIYSTWWDSVGGWHFFFQPDDTFEKGATAVATVARNPDEIDLFVTGGDGATYSTWWRSASGWRPSWFRIDSGFAKGATAVAAVARNPDELDLFITGTDHATYSTWWDPGPGILRRAAITFHPYGDKNRETIIQVFIKNRLNNSLTPQQNTDFISNWLALQRYQPGGDIDDGDQNPYLAYRLFLGLSADNPSSEPIDLQLVSDDISADDVVLPQVDIHMLANGDDRWMFDYTVTLTFDAVEYNFTSAVDGVRGIILDQNNRNHSGIGTENPWRTQPIPIPTKAATNAALKKVTLEFSTHDDNKKGDTHLNVHIVNRFSATSAQDIAIGLDLAPGEEFPDSGTRPGDQYRQFNWGPDEDLPLFGTIRLADMVLPMVYIVIVPADEDRWIFDYRVTFEFEDPRDEDPQDHRRPTRQIYSSWTRGVILDQDRNKHAGVYQGRPFPTVAPPTAPRFTDQPVDTGGHHPKIISIPFVQNKLDEFINDRDGPDNSLNPPLPPLRKIHLRAWPLRGDPSFPADVLNPDGSVAIPAEALLPVPESYADLKSIIAGGDGAVYYVSNPTSLGATGDYYVEDINSIKISLKIDPAQVAPLTVEVDFDGGKMWARNSDIDSRSFAPVELKKLTLNLTLDTRDSGTGASVFDLMSWVTQVENNKDLLDEFVKVDVDGDFSPPPPWRDAKVSTIIRDKIYDHLTKADVIANRSLRDEINSLVTSWLLGGVPDDGDSSTWGNNAVIFSHMLEKANAEAGIPEDRLTINYTGPRKVFVPQTPVDWPTGHDFSPGTLANIDHIIVLMMENRSFDHMLGYLSLPTSMHGMGRQDVDGLKGGEFNPYNGKNFPSFELAKTIFSPDPPHGYEPVHHAINGGKMDGFVKSFAEAHGDKLAGNIMGYHIGRNVLQYDALARDFAIGQRWFASHPGPTFCNRFYELTGRLNLDPHGFWEFDNPSPTRPVFTPTIFEYLSEQQVTWRYFEHAYCFLRNFEKYTFNGTNIVTADDREVGFFASARAGTLPSVSFIEPHFIEYPPGATADGPPADVSRGQDFVQQVVEAVIAGPAWNKTLLLIVYDEHGGFYDHVPPPPAVAVSDDLSIKTLGVRVPSFVISPWVQADTAFGHDGFHFDHTSILKTIARRFLSAHPPFMGARYAAANDLSMVIGTQLRQSQFLPFIRYRLTYVHSQTTLDLYLEVKGPDPRPGAVLQTNGGVGERWQDFSFEDAGDGFVYIRCHMSNLYVTAQGTGVLTSGELGTGGAVNGFPPTADAQPPGVIQDVKYQHAIHGFGRPQLQKWKFSPAGDTITHRNLYVISNQAYPDMLLQPLDPSQLNSPVVLRASGGTAIIPANTWKVSSPLLPDDVVNA